MTIERILVCDDIVDLANDWIEDIKKANGLSDGVERLDEPADKFSALLARIANEPGVQGATADAANCFDKADVLVVDYDLLQVGGDQTRHTGEEFARVARLYSDCGYIIVMNQFDEQSSFDLEMIGHLGSFADLNIGSQSIGSKMLWGTPRDGSAFAPWYWPDISATIEGRRALADLLEKRMDDSLLDVLDFPKDMASGLSDRAAGFLSGKAALPEDLAKITMRDFLKESPEHKEIERAAKSEAGRLTAFVVARLCKWYSRAVVGPQDLLVDVPHLVQRLPFVIKSDIGDPKNLDTWNKVVAEGADAIADVLQSAKFTGHKAWLGRDAYWWPKILEAPELEALRDSYDPDNFADAVFAEDASVFIPFEKATPFRAGFYNQYDVRYLSKFDGVNYAPGRRLAAV